jgi:hypothetical protein
MSTSIYEVCKALAYPVLATLCACDHQKAKSLGYKDGWQMLLDKHDDDEMAVFCTSLPTVMSPAQSQLLLNALAQEYTEFTKWEDFAAACAQHPAWKPSRETLVEYLNRREA